MTTPSQSGSPFNLKSAVEEGQTTDNGMETAIQDSPPKKNVHFFFLSSSVCLLIELEGQSEERWKKPNHAGCHQSSPEYSSQNCKRKKSVDTSTSNSVEGNPTPKPRKKKNPRLMAQAQATTESESDANLPCPPKCVVKSVLNNEGDDMEEDLPPKKGAKKNKGKGKATQGDNRCRSVA